MEALLDSVRFRKLATSSGDPSLQNFSSGSEVRESELNEIIARFYRGEAGVDSTVLVMENTFDEPVSIIVYRSLHLLPIDEEITCIFALATSVAFRGQRLADGKRPSAVLLNEAIVRIQEDAGGRIPPIMALIHRENLAARELFAQHGFAVLHEDRGDFDLYVRPAGLDTQL